VAHLAVAFAAEAYQVLRIAGRQMVVADVDHPVGKRVRAVHVGWIELVRGCIGAFGIHGRVVIAFGLVVGRGAFGVGLVRAIVRAVGGVVVGEGHAVGVVIRIFPLLLVGAHHRVGGLRLGRRRGVRIFELRIAPGISIGAGSAQLAGDGALAHEDEPVTRLSLSAFSLGGRCVVEQRGSGEKNPLCACRWPRRIDPTSGAPPRT